MFWYKITIDSKVVCRVAAENIRQAKKVAREKLVSYGYSKLVLQKIVVS